MLFALIVLNSYKEDDPIPVPPLSGEQMTFSLMSVDDSGRMGTANFAMREDGATVVTLELT